MTNRERIIEQLRQRDDMEVCADLMCPYVPGEKGADCKTGKEAERADFHEKCIPCMKRWLDSEVE